MSKRGSDSLRYKKEEINIVKLLIKDAIFFFFSKERIQISKEKTEGTNVKLMQGISLFNRNMKIKIGPMQDLE